MADEFQFDVLLSKRSNDESVVRPRADRLTKDRLARSRLLVLCLSANSFGSDWALLESGTFRFRDPRNKERRFLPVRLSDAPIKASNSRI